jgi:hypothetical protein
MSSVILIYFRVILNLGGLELDTAATVKESLTVQVEVGHAATTDEYSVVQLPEKKQKQWRTCHG